MEQSEIITAIVWAILYATGAGVLAYAGKHALTQVYGLAGVIVSPLRNLFNANSFLVLFLKARGVNADWSELDKYAELVADAIEQWRNAQPSKEPETVK